MIAIANSSANLWFFSSVVRRCAKNGRVMFLYRIPRIMCVVRCSYVCHQQQHMPDNNRQLAVEGKIYYSVILLMKIWNGQKRCFSTWTAESWIYLNSNYEFDMYAEDRKYGIIHQRKINNKDDRIGEYEQERERFMYVRCFCIKNTCQSLLLLRIFHSIKYVYTLCWDRVCFRISAHCIRKPSYWWEGRSETIHLFCWFHPIRVDRVPRTKLNPSRSLF